MISVFIVEDDPMVLEINIQFLKKISGFSIVGSAADVEEAKEQVKKQKCDLILLDNFLPNQKGIDFLKWLRKNEINSDVLLITADDSLNTVEQAFRYGAVDYLIKPFTFKRFEKALEQYKYRINRLRISETVAQEVIDDLKCGENQSEICEKGNKDENLILAKGLNENTYQQVWNVISDKKNNLLTAEQIAEKLGMARVTIRRYLEYMVKEDKIELVMEYGKVGRPQHKYCVKS